MPLPAIKNLLAENSGLSGVSPRNLVKEYLQTLALAFLYSRREYSGLIFYGGSALNHCHGLPRLSGDLDFVYAHADVTGVTLIWRGFIWDTVYR